VIAAMIRNVCQRLAGTASRRHSLNTILFSDNKKSPPLFANCVKFFSNERGTMEVTINDLHKCLVNDDSFDFDLNGSMDGDCYLSVGVCDDEECNTVINIFEWSDELSGDDPSTISVETFRKLEKEKEGILKAYDSGEGCPINKDNGLRTWSLQNITKKSFEVIFVTHFDELNSRIVDKEAMLYENAIGFLRRLNGEDRLEDNEFGYDCDDGYELTNPWNKVAEAGSKVNIDDLEAAWQYDRESSEYFDEIMKKWPHLRAKYEHLSDER
jgi:hypothetical protein